MCWDPSPSALLSSRASLQCSGFGFGLFGFSFNTEDQTAITNVHVEPEQ